MLHGHPGAICAYHHRPSHQLLLPPPPHPPHQTLPVDGVPSVHVTLSLGSGDEQQDWAGTLAVALYRAGSRSRSAAQMACVAAAVRASRTDDEIRLYVTRLLRLHGMQVTLSAHDLASPRFNLAPLRFNLAPPRSRLLGCAAQHVRRSSITREEIGEGLRSV